MRLQRLEARGFRNLADLTLDTDAQFLVIHGENAQGKTNLLEAIYAVATLKPLRGRGLRNLVNWTSERTEVSVTVAQQGLSATCGLEFDRSSRTVKLDGKKITDLPSYFDHIRAIAFCPHYGEIVTEEPKLRRAWIDRAAFTAAPTHLEVVRQFSRCLQHKSAVLKEYPVDEGLLVTLNLQLATLGAQLMDRRVAILDSLDPYIREMHSAITGQTQELTLGYRTSVIGSSAREREQNLYEQLENRRDDEIRRGMTLVGPHKDDVAITLDGRRVRTFGSRGQVRSVVLAMKLAELLAARAAGVVPVFLLDDLSSELDRNRTGRLVGILRDLDAQVVITTTSVEHLDGLPADNTKLVRVEGGHLQP